MFLFANNTKRLLIFLITASDNGSLLSLSSTKSPFVLGLCGWDHLSGHEGETGRRGKYGGRVVHSCYCREDLGGKETGVRRVCVFVGREEIKRDVNFDFFISNRKNSGSRHHVMYID